MDVAENPLTAQEIEAVLAAAAAAPSSHNAQPWRFRVRDGGIQVLADPERALPVADPDGRELRIACGAAAYNIRLAMAVCGHKPEVTLVPASDDPRLLVTVTPGAPYQPSAAERSRYEAIPRRRTNRFPFVDTAVPAQQRVELYDAARAESAWLHYVDGEDMLRDVAELIHRSEVQQAADPAFQDELRRWTGNDSPRDDGVPVAAGGPLPESEDLLARRDFTAGKGRVRLPGKEFESQPLVAVLSTLGDWNVDHLRAGMALQRVLLTGTVLGLAASFFSQPLEVPHIRAQLKQRVGKAGYPQMVMRLGYGRHLSATPRRTVTDLVE